MRNLACGLVPVLHYPFGLDGLMPQINGPPARPSCHRLVVVEW